MKNKIILLVVTIFILMPSAYAFELEDFNGTPINLDDKIGQDKWTLVMYWAHHCGVCKAEFPTISNFHSAREDVDVVGISIDGDENKHLAENLSLIHI